MSFRKKRASKGRQSESARKPSTGTRAPDVALRRQADVLWTATQPGTRGPRAMLTRDRIARAASNIADTEGLAGVSMSRVAARFGFTTMALYRYLPGKTELVNLMFDTMMGAPPDLEQMPSGWRPKLERWARGLWDLIVQHPWALDVLATLRLPGPNELAWMECGVRTLHESGLEGAPVLDSLFLVVAHVRAVAQYTVRVPEATGSLTTTDWAFGVGALIREHATRFPALAAASAAGAFASVEDPLAFGLERVLDGIDVLIAETAESRRDAPRSVQPRSRKGSGRASSA